MLPWDLVHQRIPRAEGERPLREPRWGGPSPHCQGAEHVPDVFIPPQLRPGSWRPSAKPEWQQKPGTRAWNKCLIAFLRRGVSGFRKLKNHPKIWTHGRELLLLILSGVTGADVLSTGTTCSVVIQPQPFRFLFGSGGGGGFSFLFLYKSLFIFFLFFPSFH